MPYFTGDRCETEINECDSNPCLNNGKTFEYQYKHVILIQDGATETISLLEKAGFNVIRDPISGWVSYRGQKFDANYMNWLVGNGFVITVGFGDDKLDEAAKSRIESYFPGRDVYVIEMLESWYAGGGVHCHTNDQPSKKLLDG